MRPRIAKGSITVRNIAPTDRGLKLGFQRVNGRVMPLVRNIAPTDRGLKLGFQRVNGRVMPLVRNIAPTDRGLKQPMRLMYVGLLEWYLSETSPRLIGD
jgi:hypothetical protein